MKLRAVVGSLYVKGALAATKFGWFDSQCSVDREIPPQAKVRSTRLRTGHPDTEPTELPAEEVCPRVERLHYHAASVKVPAEPALAARSLPATTAPCTTAGVQRFDC